MPLKTSLEPLVRSEDWWACWLGFSLFLICLLGFIDVAPKFGIWYANPLEALPTYTLISYILVLVVVMILGFIGMLLMSKKPLRFPPAFVVMSILGLCAQLISQQYFIDLYGLEYVLWALAIGLVISNTIGLPAFLKPAVKTELYIKTGLVLLGAEILFSRILNLGLQGLILAWGVTPIVLYFMYRYGTSTLKLDKTLSVLIASATSVCGVSAAIAVAAATKAKKEHLTLTISFSLISTVILLLGLPALIKAIGISYVVGGAWIGGTVDSTGAVVAAGELLNQQAMEVATVVKLIQNVMIGLIAFVVAILWVTRVERDAKTKPGPAEIWYRFPKFVIAFMILSLISSFILIPMMGEPALNDILRSTSNIRTFLFAAAFLSIGLESDLKSLGRQIQGGRPVNLYVVGQTFNIILTLVVAWLLFDYLAAI
ncbi:MAG: putative sulfate exporter family transporter [Candidatus Bathyarchaeota archaeon]|nr:MAG: putative sulfate exporter family transporter [Candidatus Bathyarchaeota archaeon]